MNFFTLLLIAGIVVTADAVRTRRQSQITWSEWGSWGKCSHHCGSGIRRRDRVCVVPPAWGGNRGSRLAYARRYCDEHTEYEICNPTPCSGVDVIEQHPCSKYNTPHDVWMPFTRMAARQCAAYCYKVGGSRLRQIPLLDGSACEHASSPKGICVANKCTPIGCDGKLNSMAKLDACGVCKGNGKDCEVMNGTRLFQSTADALGTYVDVVLIPSGSRSIHVEKTCAGLYLAVMDSDGLYVVNGGRVVGASKNVRSSGATIEYVRDGDKEMIDSVGPTTSKLTVRVLSTELTFCNVRYSLVASKEDMKRIETIAAVEGSPASSKPSQDENRNEKINVPSSCPKKCPKVKNRVERFCSSDYVVRGLVLRKTTSNFHYEYFVEISEVYKGDSPGATLYTESLCKCPNLKLGETYLIMGSRHVDAQGRVRWMVGAEDYVKPWRKNTGRKLPQLSEKCRK